MPGWTCFRGTTRVANGAAVVSPQLRLLLLQRQQRVREVMMVPFLALKQPPSSSCNCYTSSSGSRRSHSNNNNSGISGGSPNPNQTSPYCVTTDGTDDEDQLDRQRYTELTKEYQAITKETVPKFSLKLYRTIMRAIYKQLQHGNQHDQDEFQKREERQRRHLESSSISSMPYGGPEAVVAIPELLSLVDTLPINREEELQSRMNYYIQYTRENFLQNSDVLQDLPPPVDRVRERKRNFDYHHNNNTNDNSNRSSSHTNSKPPRMLIDDGPIPHQTIRYTTEQEEQYAMIQRWIHVVQQGYIHLDWILRDMKFVPPTTTSATTSMTARSKNRIQTNRSVVDRQKQQEIQTIQLQMQRYVDHVLQYNLQISHPLMDDHDDVDDDMVRRRVVETTMNARSGHHVTDFEWSDDEDDDDE